MQFDADRSIVLHWFEEEINHGRRLLFAPLPVGLGVLTQFHITVSNSLFPLLFVFCSSAGFYMFARRQNTYSSWIAAVVVLFVGGMLAAWIEIWRAETVMLDSAVTTSLTGRVERHESDGPHRWRYIITLENTERPHLKRPPDRLSLIVRSQEQPFEHGQRITGRARLTPASGPALPGLKDFAFGAYFDGIGVNGYFYGTPEIVSPYFDAPETHQWGKLQNWLYHCRSRIGDRIRTLLPGDTGAFAASLVTDERRAISEETTEALRQSGLAHIVAISGLNMALSAGIFFVGLRMVLSLMVSVCHAFPAKKIAALGALITLTAYYLISGFAVSAERAFIMMAIMLIAVFLDRPSISLRNVALSALVIMVMSPSEILGASFQMSFAATLALVAGYEAWKQKPSMSLFSRVPVPKAITIIWRFLAGIFATSLIGGLSTAIFSAEHFHRLTAYGLPANLAAMPIISFIVMPAGMAAMLLMPFGLDPFFWQIAGFGLDLVVDVAMTVSSWGGNIDTGRLPDWYFQLTVTGFLFLVLLKTRLRHIGTVIAAGCSLFMLTSFASENPDIIISEDGDLVAVLDEKGAHLNRAKPSSFIFSQWQRALRITDWHQPDFMETPLTSRIYAREEKFVKLSKEEKKQALQDMKDALTGKPMNAFICTKKAWCIAKLKNGHVLTTVDHFAYMAAACDISDIVVTSTKTRWTKCYSGAQLFTNATLRKSGSVEIYLHHKPLVKSAFSSLDYPWRIHRAYDWKTDRFSALNDSDGSAQQVSPEF